MSTKGLGRGLNALFTHMDDGDEVSQISISELRPNPYQPRKHFDEESLTELRDSIQQHGIVQPIVVRKSLRGYEIAAGERRFRAARLCGLESVPVVVRDFNDEQMMEIAVIENLQREDLNPIEVAGAYRKLMEQLTITQEELARRMGKSRSHITNFLRLLQLPQKIQNYVSKGQLSMGHAKVLLGVKDMDEQNRLADKVIKENASVRQLEEWTQRIHRPVPTAASRKPAVSAQIRHYESVLQQVFSTAVKIRPGRRKGRIEIEYYSERELERLIHLLDQNRMAD